MDKSNDRGNLLGYEQNGPQFFWRSPLNPTQAHPREVVVIPLNFKHLPAATRGISGHTEFFPKTPGICGMIRTI
jgi:hypothetical protein